MIDMNEENLHLFDNAYNVRDGKLVKPYLELTGENFPDKSFLIHISREVKRFNEQMHEEKIKMVIERAWRKCDESKINIPFSYAVYETLKDEGYLKSYEEWI
jgi:hypothetical protein